MWWVVGLVVLIIIISQSSSNKQNTSYIQQLSPKRPGLRNIKQVDLSEVTLSDEQQELFENLENSNENFFITGKAGTGKSLLLQWFKQKSAKRIVVCAPTGVAALNVGGQTINSLLKIRPGFVSKTNIRVDPRTAMVLRNIDCIVIDEISMVRADLMDGVNYILQLARGNLLPFGGLQIIMFGDLYQLPPVIDDKELHKYFSAHHGGFYFFNAHVWRDAPLVIRELKTIHRQTDDEFKKILNEIRTGTVSADTLKVLNSRVTNEIPEEVVITLSTTNAVVSGINFNGLSRLTTELYEYQAQIEGEIEASSYPADEVLQLKIGAQVMFLKNDKDKRWVNGTLGIVSKLSDNEITVKIDDDNYQVSPETWSKIRYYYNHETRKVEEEVISSFTQIPLKLAWAITVHKSQGQTYEAVVLDMGSGAFAHGQTYVALSRCKTLGGIYLKRAISKEDIIVDPCIVKFMSKERARASV